MTHYRAILCWFSTLGVALVMAASVLLVSASARASEAFDAEDYAGKVVVLDFWASWCVPCRRSFPWLNAMHAKYSGEGL
ncbi:MAG: redoxin family protein, partial [Gammaproteobacteria bacterium]|nr:redoxin family protein [Gammaproteobacteria bacterium]